MARLVGRPNVVIDGDIVRWSASVDDKALWFAIPKKFERLITERLDAALITLLYPSMKTGEDIVLDGSVSEKLFYYASGPLQAALTTINPNLKRIGISASRIVRPRAAEGVASGFSGGIDSFSVIKRHFLACKPSDFRLTHLTLHDVWNSEKFVEFDEKKLRTGMKNVFLLAEKWGLPLVTVSSNVGVFYVGSRFEDTHTFRNIAVSHILSEGIGRFIYASAYPMHLQTLKGANTIGRADAFILPMLSSDAIDCFSGDPELSRIEKTVSITDVEETKKYLHVCAGTWETNCSSCFKCRRTILTLEMLGKLNEYEGAFNIKKYKKERSAWIDNIKTTKDIYLLEIIAFAEKNGLEIPTE